MKKFLAYWRSMRLHTQPKYSAYYYFKILLPIIVCVTTVAVSYPKIPPNGFSIGSFFVAFPLMTLVLSIVLGMREKPSLVLLVPIGYKRRSLYSILCIFLNSLLGTLAWYAVFSVLGLIGIGIGILASNAPSSEVVAVLNDSFSSPSAMGVVFLAAMALYHFGAGILLGYGTKPKTFWWRFALYAVVTLVFTFTLLGCVVSVTGDFDMGGIAGNIANLPSGWVVVSVYAAVSAVIFALAVLWVLKVEKPKKF